MAGNMGYTSTATEGNACGYHRCLAGHSATAGTMQLYLPCSTRAKTVSAASSKPCDAACSSAAASSTCSFALRRWVCLSVCRAMQRYCPNLSAASCGSGAGQGRARQDEAGQSRFGQASQAIADRYPVSYTHMTMSTNLRVSESVGAGTSTTITTADNGTHLTLSTSALVENET